MSSVLQFSDAGDAAVVVDCGTPANTSALNPAINARVVALAARVREVPGVAGVAPFVGGLILTYVFVKSIIDLSDPANSESGNSWLGLGPPLVIAIFFLLLGLVIMLLQWRVEPGFFRRKSELPSPAVQL